MRKSIVSAVTLPPFDCYETVPLVYWEVWFKLAPKILFVLGLYINSIFVGVVVVIVVCG